MTDIVRPTDDVHQTLSVVIPVYSGDEGVAQTCQELLREAAQIHLADDVRVELLEVFLVCDNPQMPDSNLERLRVLEESDRRIRVVWLSKNFGQHPATIAGIVSTNGDWVVTMDEDGQHDPRYIADMLRTAATTNSPLVYASPTNQRPHGALRNLTSWLAGRVARMLAPGSTRYHSYRLMEGSLGRAACAYAGENVFLDVALGWTCGNAAQCPMPMRGEHGQSSYNYRRLLSHFWRMVLSSGTTPLRMVALAGFVVATIGMIAGAFVIFQRLSGVVDERGWASLFAGSLVLFGGLYISLAVLAEYIGMIVRNTVGRPVYVKAEGPQVRALARLRAALTARPGA
jgi:undecaprenyl-phosphate 4-deoxy-4-formamido-L-arabinose transferase